MPNTKTARSGDPDQAREREEDCYSNYSTDGKIFEGKISRYLRPGRENAMHASELTRLTGLEAREIRQAVERATQGDSADGKG